MIWIQFIAGYMAVSVISTAIFCRSIHNSKVRDEREPFYGSFEA